MAEYFEEKSFQVEPSDLVAFGVSIGSRYGQAHEIISMINFAERLGEAGLQKLVPSVFYDSKACICTIELTTGVAEGSAHANAIKAAATATIDQFLWFDIVCHGGRLAQEEND